MEIENMRALILIIALAACAAEPAPITSTHQQDEMCQNCGSDGGWFNVEPDQVPATSTPLNNYDVIDLKVCAQSGAGQALCCATHNDYTWAGVCCSSSPSIPTVCWYTDDITYWFHS